MFLISTFTCWLSLSVHSLVVRILQFSPRNSIRLQGEKEFHCQNSFSIHKLILWMGQSNTPTGILLTTLKKKKKKKLQSFREVSFFGWSEMS